MRLLIKSNLMKISNTVVILMSESTENAIKDEDDQFSLVIDLHLDVAYFWHCWSMMKEIIGE